MTDKINPSYYVHNGVEAFDNLEDELGVTGFLFYLQGCIRKYLWRWKDKNGVEDLKKARRCLDQMIEVAEGQETCNM